MNLAYLPPLHWQDFEALTLAKARCLFNDVGAQANGRPGFEQHGVHVYGRHPGTNGWIATAQTAASTLLNATLRQLLTV
jgi:hypothetical protein